MSGSKKEKIPKLELAIEQKTDKEEEIIEVEVEKKKINKAKPSNTIVNDGEIEKKNGINPRIL